jgi:hypothetical protein
VASTLTTTPPRRSTSIIFHTLSASTPYELCN